jgi:hypothetical protein
MKTTAMNKLQNTTVQKAACSIFEKLTLMQLKEHIHNIHLTNP